MTAKQVSVGLTYNVKFGDTVDPVTLTKECEWGGFYGRNERTGNTVRIKNAARLIAQTDGGEARHEARMQELADHIIHTYSKENTAMPTSTPAQRSKRAARRNANVATPAPVETESVLDMARRVDKAMAEAGTTVAEVNTAAKHTAKRKPKAKPAATPTGKVTLASTARKAAKPKPKAKPRAAKSIVIDLTVVKFTDTKGRFEYVGDAESPFIRTLYISIDSLVAMGDDMLAVEFEPYVQTGKKNPQSKSQIRYSGMDEAISDLYLNRVQAEAKGFTNDSHVHMDIVATSKDSIQVAVRLV